MVRNNGNLPSEQLLKLRYALALRKLMQENELIKEKSQPKKDSLIIASLGQLSSSTGLRRATLSAIFNGDSNPSVQTVYLILEALGKTLTQFASYFDAITDKDALLYYKEIQANKKQKTRRKI